METTQYDTISPTAKLVALYRASAIFRTLDKIAEIVNAKATCHEIWGEEDVLQATHHIAPLVEAQLKALSEAIKRMGIKNIMEIAAGILSIPGGLTMTEDPNVN